MPPPLQAARAGRTQCWCCGVPCVGLCSPESNPYLLQEKDQILELLRDFFLLFFHFLSSIFFFFWRGISKIFHPASLQCSCRGAVCVTHPVQQREIPSWPLWEGELCKPQPNSPPCSVGCGAPLQSAGHDPSSGMGVLGMPDPTGLLILFKQLV